MKRLVLAAAAMLALGAAQATVLTFTGAGSANSATYTESGFTLTLSSCPGCTPHYGDGTGNVNTFNWHDGGANASGMTVTLTMNGGGAFSLFGLDAVSGGVNNLSINGVGYSTGPVALNLLNVTSVVFRDTTGNGVSIDNLNLGAASAVPEPASLALVGLGLLGLAATRRRRAA